MGREGWSSECMEEERRRVYVVGKNRGGSVAQDLLWQILGNTVHGLLCT